MPETKPDNQTIKKENDTSNDRPTDAAVSDGKKTGIDKKKYYDILYKEAVTQITYYDKLIISLASGALFLPLLLKNSFPEYYVIRLQGCLVLSWVFWISSIIVLLFSHYFSYKAHWNRLTNINKEITRLDRFYVFMTNSGTLLSGLALVGGIITFIIFVNSNLEMILWKN